ELARVRVLDHVRGEHVDPAAQDPPFVVGALPAGFELAQRREPRRVLQESVPRDLRVGHRFARRRHIVGKAHLRDPEKVFLTGMQLDVSGLELLEDIALHVHDVTLRHRRPLRSRQSRFHTIRCAARAQRGRAVNGFHRRGRVVKIAARGLGRQRFEGPMPDASTALAQKIAQTIAAEIGADAFKVQAAVALLDDGATVPFIARYRKEATGGLDDAQLRTLEQRLAYLRELEDRRKTILASIDEQGKLTPELKAEIEAADTKSRLEDL